VKAEVGRIFEDRKKYKIPPPIFLRKDLPPNKAVTILKKGNDF
jgi:hypothetical protein